MRRVLLALLALLLLWPAGFAFFVWRVAVASPEMGQAEAAVVFTGGAERLSAGLRLLQERRVERLLISGVGHAASLRELAGAAGFELAALPALAPRITLGRTAESTRGNAIETADWARQGGVQALIVVTADYHMPRALAELRQYLPDATLIAYPVHPLPAHVDAVAWRRLVGEYNKFIAVRFGVEALAGRLGFVLSEHAL